MSGRARSARLRYRGSLAGGRGNPVRRTASRRSSPTGTRGRTGTGQAASGTARRAPGGVEHRAVAIGDQAVVIGDQDDAVAAWDLKAAFHRDRAASRWHLDAPGAGRTGCARSGPHWGGGSALRERHAATCGTRPPAARGGIGRAPPAGGAVLPGGAGAGRGTRRPGQPGRGIHPLISGSHMAAAPGRSGAVPPRPNLSGAVPHNPRTGGPHPSTSRHARTKDRSLLIDKPDRGRAPHRDSG